MNLNKLRVFYYAAQANSFSNCGLTLSPSAVSRHISDLEYALGVKLFLRNSRTMVLTSDGEKLLSACKGIFSELESLQQSFRDAEDELDGELRIVTPGGWASTIIIQYLKDFLKTYPKLRLSVLSADRPVSFARNEADVIITTTEPTDPELSFAHITTLTLKLYASLEYLKNHGFPRSVSDLDHHRLIAYPNEDGLLQGLAWHLKIGRSGDSPRIPYMIVNNLYPAGEEGYGIVTLAQENKLLQQSKLVEVLPEVSGPSIDAYCVYSRHLEDTKRISVFVDFLRHAAEKAFHEP